MMKDGDDYKLIVYGTFWTI